VCRSGHAGRFKHALAHEVGERLTGDRLDRRADQNPAETRKPKPRTRFKDQIAIGKEPQPLSRAPAVVAKRAFVARVITNAP
jgi:hypothetical protein